MIKRFEKYNLFESNVYYTNYLGGKIPPEHLIGMKAILKDQKNARRMPRDFWVKPYLTNTKCEVGWNFIIREVFVENDIIYISEEKVKLGTKKDYFGWWYKADCFDIKERGFGRFEDPYDEENWEE